MLESCTGEIGTTETAIPKLLTSTENRKFEINTPKPKP